MSIESGVKLKPNVHEKMGVTIVFDVRGIEQPIDGVQTRCIVRSKEGGGLDLGVLGGETTIEQLLAAARDKYGDREGLQWLRQLPGL